jgi:hypothetical protein
LCIGRNEHSVVFEEHEHADVNTARNNMRAAVIHIIAEAAESLSRNLSPVPSQCRASVPLCEQPALGVLVHQSVLLVILIAVNEVGGSSGGLQLSFLVR